VSFVRAQTIRRSVTVKKSGNARTTIGDISATGFELSNEALATVIGGMQCGGDTPYEKATATLTSQNGTGVPDTMTDCTSKKP